jgi:hypothetical protein
MNRSAAHSASRPLPPTPTIARPGSREKVAVMADRVSRGYQAMHPKDATLDTTPNMVAFAGLIACETN